MSCFTGALAAGRLLPCMAARQLCLFLVLILLAGCGLKRNAVPVDLQGQAEVPGFKHIRFFGDTIPENMDEMMETWSALSKRADRASEINFLSLSGGGADGAFGAGFLCGWTNSGHRPQFNLVTGISTGALIAPFAFLGPEYDNLIKLFYTTFSTRDLIRPRPFVTALAGDAVYSTKPLQDALKTYITGDFIAKIAEEHRKGRRLFIGTTNLDAMRPVYWDIGLIAQYGTEKSDQLIRDVILASASVPVAFPPVYFTVRVGGRVFDEMHVDGGVTNQVFTYPANIHLAEELKKIGEKRKITLFVIRNDSLLSDGQQIDPYLGDIAARSLAGLIRNQGIGDLYRIFYTAQRDGIDFNLAFIPPDYNEESDELFSPVYMKKLFDLGRNMATGGNPWHKSPPSRVSSH